MDEIIRKWEYKLYLHKQLLFAYIEDGGSPSGNIKIQAKIAMIQEIIYDIKFIIRNCKK